MADRADRVESRGAAFIVLSEGGEELARFTGTDAEAKANERLRQIEAAKAAKGDMADSATVRRYDRGMVVRKPRRDASTGVLIVTASVTRAPAVFTYRNRDGSIRREFRDAASVFSRKNRDAMARSPVTIGHPRERVTTKNMKRLSVGHGDGSISIEKDHAVVGLIIDDESGIKVLDSGEMTETSCGYDCDLVMQPGVWVDDAGVPHSYDAIQTNHRNNHIALCHEGRAGTTRVHMDSLDRTDAYQIEETQMPEDKAPEQLLVSGTDNTARLKIDGIEVPLELSTARLVQDALAKAAKATAEATAKTDALEAERDALKADHDKVEAERDALKKADEKNKDDEETDEEKKKAFLEKVDARIEFNTDAVKHFDEKGWADMKGKSEPEIREAAVRAAHPDMKLDGKSEDYFQAAYDMLPAPKSQSRGDVQSLASAVLHTDSRAPDSRADVQKRIDTAQKRDDDAWTQTIPGGMTRHGKTEKPETRARF